MKVLVLLALVALAYASNDFPEDWEAWKEVEPPTTYLLHDMSFISSLTPSSPHPLIPSPPHPLIPSPLTGAQEGV